MSEQAQPSYILRYFFEWGGGCLWGGNDTTYRDFGLGPYDLEEPCLLPLSHRTLAKCRELADWHDGALNWDSPADPGPWSEAEYARFNAAAVELLAAIQAELGPMFSVLDERFD
jgi:hypothetical protein